jgi:hypothetical protein
MTEHEFFISVSQIPRQRVVVKIFGIEYIHHTRQVWKFELKLGKLRNKI